MTMGEIPLCARSRSHFPNLSAELAISLDDGKCTGSNGGLSAMIPSLLSLAAGRRGGHVSVIMEAQYHQTIALGSRERR